MQLFILLYSFGPRIRNDILRFVGNLDPSGHPDEIVNPSRAYKTIYDDTTFQDRMAAAGCLPKQIFSRNQSTCKELSYATACTVQCTAPPCNVSSYRHPTEGSASDRAMNTQF